jgi:DNA-binding transcriptional ArsR family regulator
MRLARGEAAVGDLARPFGISLPAVSRHVRVLEHARLIERRVDAQWRVCRLRPAPLRAAASWIDHYRCFQEEQLDDLAALLEQPQPTRKKR